MNYLQHQENSIEKACHNYADFHIMTLNQAIVDKDSGQTYYKPAFFHDFTPSDKSKILRHEHTQYKLIHKQA